MALIHALELTELTARYGEPLRWHCALDVTRDYVNEWLLQSQKREAEIVLVLPRPGDCVLLHTKDFYPPGIYRVPTGGVKIGERIVDAAYREMREETGFAVPLTRLLGIIEYEFRHAALHVPFVSYVFLTAETRDAPQPMDPGERIMQFRDAPWSELPNITRALDELSGDRRDWGRFRAVAHRLIYQVVAS